MNKTELIKAMAEKTGMTKIDTKKALNSFMEVLHDEMKKGEKLALVGFGTFSVSERKAHKGKNPRTGKVIKIAAKKSVKFKAGAGLAL